MSALVFDIETDGLDPDNIWCMSIIDSDTEEQFNYGPEELEEGISKLKAADKLIGHNILCFDMPVLKKLKGVDLFDKKIVDTLVLSRLFNPVREGNHGLERWGYHLGCPKIDFEEYDKYSQEMLDYCAQDVLLNFRVYQALKKESVGFTMRSVQLEHEVAEILNEQRQHGFLLDQDKASDLLEELNIKQQEIEKEVMNSLGNPPQEFIVTPKYTKSGALSKLGTATSLEESYSRKLTEDEYEYFKENGPDSSITFQVEDDFNLNSRKQIGERLINIGWVPSHFTPTGQPIIDEGTLNKAKDIPEALLISRYLMLGKRISQLVSWFKEVNKETGRVHGFVNHNGTITGRMTHRSPNMAQIPNSGSEYGAECRSCWTVPEGYKLVGIDASGLELRMLAHYMNDEDYTNEIINGDIHTTNQKLAGLKSRNQAKTFIYAFLYGAGDAKIGAVVRGTKKDGARLKQSFLNNLPSLKSLRTSVSREAAKGYLKGLDGRKLFVRSEHSALNTLLQGAGAIVMKQAMIIFKEKIKELNACFVANVHDEWQLEVIEDQADLVGRLGVEAIVEAGLHFKMNCPLDGEYNIGGNWSETH
jgi:DNA polymerase I